LTSSSSIFLVQDLADPIVGERGRERVLAPDQRHLDARLRVGEWFHVAILSLPTE
jgi:hypothetical protein